MNQPAHSITDAPVKHSVEQRGRMVRYSIAMATRILCSIAAAVVALVWESWWAMAFAGAAVVLPYVAVVAANAGGGRYMAARQEVQQQRVLGRTHEEPEPKQWWEDEPDQQSSASSTQVIEGVLVQEPVNDQDAQERGS